MIFKGKTSDVHFKLIWPQGEDDGPVRGILGELGSVNLGEEKPDLAVVLVGREPTKGWPVVRALAREGVPFLLVARQPEVGLYREALRLGAKDLLVEPVGEDELRRAVREALAGPDQGRGRVITMFSTKGGVGKSTIAANLAVALGRLASRPVALADYDLALGNVASLFGLRPESGLPDVVGGAGWDEQRLLAALTRVEGQPVEILGPAREPELAEVVEGDGKPDPDRNYAQEALQMLRESHDFTVVDTGVNFREATLTALDEADKVLLVTTPDVPALQNSARALDLLLHRLGYPREKILVVLNRADAALGLTPDDIAGALNFPIGFRIPSDGELAVRAANAGQVLLSRRSRGAIGKALLSLAGLLFREAGSLPARRW